MQRKLLYILLTLALIALFFTGCKEDKAGQPEPTTSTVVVEKQLLNEPRWVTADPSLRMRDSAGSEGSVIGNIPLGEEVTLLEESRDELTIAGATGRWSRVKWNKLEGWVFGGFLTAKRPVVEEVKSDYEEREGWISEVAGATLFSNVDNILKANPITTVITHLDYGTKVIVIGEKSVGSEQFYQVNYQSKSGWIKSHILTENELTKQDDILNENQVVKYLAGNTYLLKYCYELDSNKTIKKNVDLAKFEQDIINLSGTFFEDFSFDEVEANSKWEYDIKTNSIHIVGVPRISWFDGNYEMVKLTPSVLIIRGTNMAMDGEYLHILSKK